MIKMKLNLVHHHHHHPAIKRTHNTHIDVFLKRIPFFLYFELNWVLEVVAVVVVVVLSS
jgi:hypothetical protein